MKTLPSKSHPKKSVKPVAAKSHAPKKVHKVEAAKPQPAPKAVPSKGDTHPQDTSDLAAITSDLTALQDHLTKLQSTPGPISYEDQMTLDEAEMIANNLSIKLKAA